MQFICKDLVEHLFLAYKNNEPQKYMDGYWKISLAELVYNLVRETETHYINKNSWDF